jgi:hypothetical protein
MQKKMHVRGGFARRSAVAPELLERRSLLSASLAGQPDLAPYQPAGWSGSIVVSTVRDTHFDSVVITPSDELFIDLAVQNLGDVASGAFSVEVRVDGNLLPSTPASTSLNPINPSGAFFAVNDLVQEPLAAGEHTISVTIDPLNAVTESDETNNVFSKTFTVGQNINQPPTIASLSVNPDPVSVGQPVTLTANDVADPEGGILNVQFFRESNGLLGLQTGEGGDLLLSTDFFGPYSAEVQTTGLPVGDYTYYARATDVQGLLSQAVSAISAVRPGAISATPAAPDLLAESDTGGSDSDNLTRLDNGSAAEALNFSVGGTVPGAVVQLFVGGVQIGQATATSATTVITTNGSVKLAEGMNEIFAAQTEPGKTRSGPSSGARITIDTVAPQVVGLEVAGRTWSNNFVNFLETSGVGAGHGFSVPFMLDVVTILPWTNLDRITFTLNEPADTAAQGDDLAVTGLAVPQYDVSPAATTDGASLTYTLARTLPAERARLLFSGADLAGNSVADGEGGAFNYVLDVLPADVNQSGGAVGATDVVLTRNRIGRSIASPGSGATAYSAFNDVNGDGIINASDLVLVRNRVGTTQPSAPAGLFSFRPVRLSLELFKEREAGE